MGVGNCMDFDLTKSRKPTPSCFLPALHHAKASWISSFRVPACNTLFVVNRCSVRSVHIVCVRTTR